MIAIVGVGSTEHVRRSTRPIGDLVVEASLAAIADAGLQPGDIDGIVTDVSYMPVRAPADEVATALGIGERCFTAHGLVGGAGPDAAGGGGGTGRANAHRLATRRDGAS